MKIQSGAAASNEDWSGPRRVLCTLAVSMEAGSPRTPCLWRKRQHISCGQLLLFPHPLRKRKLDKVESSLGLKRTRLGGTVVPNRLIIYYCKDCLCSWSFTVGFCHGWSHCTGNHQEKEKVSSDREKLIWGCEQGWENSIKIAGGTGDNEGRK